MVSMVFIVNLADATNFFTRCATDAISFWLEHVWVLQGGLPLLLKTKARLQSQ
jgi:hypothetical protein